jgi:K+-sensing histidine kinase KdpD
LRRVVLIGLGAFTESFDEKNIKVVVHIPEDVTYDFDYKTFNAGLFNLLDNVQKYANQYSELKIVFSDHSLKFITTSIRINKEELEKIFEMNYRGNYVRDNTTGEGVGMYTSKKLFIMNGIEISAPSDYSTQEIIGKERYCLNTFTLSF